MVNLIVMMENIDQLMIDEPRERQTLDTPFFLSLRGQAGMQVWKDDHRFSSSGPSRYQQHVPEKSSPVSFFFHIFKFGYIQIPWPLQMLQSPGTDHRFPGTYGDSVPAGTSYP